MKILMKPIQMICWFDEEGKLTPIRFRMTAEDQSLIVVKVSNIIDVKEEKLAGNRMIVYTCQSIVGNEERLYVLKYEITKCRWFLFKM